MRGRRLVAVGTALVLFALVSACGGDDDDDTGAGGPSTSEQASDDGAIDPSREIRSITSGPPPGSWDPATFTGSLTQLPKFYSSVYDTLLRINEEDELVPLLATEWEYDATLTKLTLTLRDDVTFSDGAKFDATAAKLNLDRVRTSPTPAGRLLTGITAVDVTSPTQLVITQAAPNSKIVSALASPAAAMASPAVIQSNPASLAQKPVGSGPFLLEKVDATSATFVRNDDYWDRETVFPARHIISGAVDPNARINAILTGAVDFSDLSQEPPSSDLLAAVEAGKLKLVTVKAVPSMIGVNNKVPPLDNPKVIEAINYALDREQINEIVYDGLCEPTAQLFVPGMDGYIDGLEYKFDLKKAQQLMDEAGVGKVTIKFQSVAGADPATADLYASMLAKIGITLDISTSSIQEVFPNFFAGKFGLSALQLFISMPDAAYVPDFITGPLNPGTKDPALVQMVSKAVALAPDDPGRDRAFREINQFVYDNPFTVALCQLPRTLVAHPDVVGIDEISLATIGGMDTSRLGLRRKR